MTPSSRPRRTGTRTGFTTGACAAAAARAATLGLARGRLPETVETLLPNGQSVPFAVAAGWVRKQEAEAVVIKDAGDDPDCTHGAHITAHARALPGDPGGIHLLGGAGVGRVTRPGLGLPLDQAAINPVPRLNIADNVRLAAGGLLERGHLEVTISVPGGAALAAKTLNPRLGILGGISILGTTGIVHPYSTAAYKAVVQQSVRACATLGAQNVVFTTGRRSERFAMARMAELPEHVFIQMGDFFAAAMASAAAAAIPRVVVAAMVGKLAKIGQGLDNTHARKGVLDMARIAALAQRAGAPEAVCREAAEGITARHAAGLLAGLGLEEPFYRLLAADAARAMAARLPAGTRVTALAFDFDGRLLAAGDGGTNG